MIDYIKRAAEEAKEDNHRRMIVVSRARDPAKIVKLVRELLPKEYGYLYVSANLSNEVKAALGEFEWVKPEDTEVVLGTTWDLLVVDEPQDLSPNSLGRVVETVKGGGLLLFFTKDIGKWGEEPAEYHLRIVSPPYTLEDVKRRFTFRLKRKLFCHRGIVIFDDEKLIYESLGRNPSENKRAEKPRDEIEALTKTDDQLLALRSIRSVAEERGKAALIIKADRGRGKSVALGLGLSALIADGLVRGDIFLTAPSKQGISQVFKFLGAGLRARGVEYKMLDDEALDANIATVKFVSPYHLSRKDGALAVVDEAAGIPLPLLLKYPLRFSKVIYSSTVHGYEGSGRGFGIRFRKLLEKFELEIMEVEMSKPIRYAEGDPIEKWLYDVLLLDSEPDRIEPEEVEVEKLEYLKIDRDALFESMEDRLRAFIGTYVTAHYRNRPDDLVLLGEAPHHFARTLSLPDGRIAVALHLAKEGDLSEDIIEEMSSGELPPGHLIPGVLLKHYPVFKYFGTLKGVRIVRIATNPALFRRGLGSMALAMLEKEMKPKVDWIGASFGASIELLGFWLKNGYVPVHISPMRNASSGEYSVIFIKPISSKAKSYVLSINQEFRNRFFNSLHDTYYGMPIGTAILLFRGFETRKVERAKLTENQKARLESYIKGTLSYESVTDVIRELLRAHFFTGENKRLEMPDKVLRAMAAKCLQGRSWQFTNSILGTNEPHPIFRKHVERMREKYVA